MFSNRIAMLLRTGEKILWYIKLPLNEIPLYFLNLNVTNFAPIKYIWVKWFHKLDQFVLSMIFLYSQKRIGNFFNIYFYISFFAWNMMWLRYMKVERQNGSRKKIKSENIQKLSFIHITPQITSSIQYHIQYKAGGNTREKQKKNEKRRYQKK